KQRFAQGDGVFVAADRARARWQLLTSRGGVLLGNTHAGAWNRGATYQDRPWRPALVVDVGHPVEKGDQGGDVFVAEVLVRHQSTVSLFVIETRRVLEKSRQVRRAAVLGNLGQIRCVVGTLAEQGMTVD